MFLTFKFVADKNVYICGEVNCIYEKVVYVYVYECVRERGEGGVYIL